VLIVVRHGQTEANAGGKLLGRADVALNAVGERQAAALAGAIARPARVVSSPLERARRTAAAFGVPVEIDERWIEIDYGEYDCWPLADVPAEMWDQWRADAAYAPPGGESLVDVGRRVRAACTELSEGAVSDDVVVVSHVSPIKAAVAWALGVGDELTWRTFVAVASITRIAVSARGPVLQSFNETTHLLS
jgi:broad specificity phosphatase PhoE